MFDLFEEYDNPYFTERGLLISKLVRLRKFVRYFLFYFSLLDFCIFCVSLTVKLILTWLNDDSFIFFEVFFIIYDIVGTVFLLIFSKVEIKVNKLFASIALMSMLNLLVVSIVFFGHYHFTAQFGDFVLVLLFLLQWLMFLLLIPIVLSIKRTQKN
ncbi:MAG: hypothetical protein LBU60_02615 [Clostridiales bacterium]|jgi:hypothetical protein|nr:hypothetical protein [Clostridiales bacterium]